MSDQLFFIYLAIGVAHFAAHVLSCPQCRKQVILTTTFFLEGVIKTLGWPFQLGAYLREMTRSRSVPGFRIVEVAQRDGETVAEFEARVKAAIQANLGKAAADEVKP